MAWLSRLREAQVKYKDAVKQTRNSVSSDDNNTRRSRRSSSNVTHSDIVPTTTTTKTTGCSRQRSPRHSPRHSRVSLTQQQGTAHRPSLLTGRGIVVPSASLNSAFWSSTSSDRRSTTSSLQSVSTFRGVGATAYGKAVISRTSSAGPAMRGIEEEDVEFWQLLQQQQTTCDDVERGRAVGVGRQAVYRSPVRLQAAGIRASFSQSCPCLSLAAVARIESMLLARHDTSPGADDVDNSKHRRLRSLAGKVQPRVTQN